MSQQELFELDRRATKEEVQQFWYSLLVWVKEKQSENTTKHS